MRHQIHTRLLPLPRPYIQSAISPAFPSIASPLPPRLSSSLTWTPMIAPDLVSASLHHTVLSPAGTASFLNLQSDPSRALCCPQDEATASWLGISFTSLAPCLRLSYLAVPRCLIQPITCCFIFHAPVSSYAITTLSLPPPFLLTPVHPSQPAEVSPV